MDRSDGHETIQTRAHYSPPWADVSIIGIAGSSGSGKSTLSQAIVRRLNLPWVVILSMDSFYKTLDKDQSRLAFACEYDFDSPEVRGQVLGTVYPQQPQTSSLRLL
jgi:uridine kinase